MVHESNLHHSRQQHHEPHHLAAYTNFPQIKPQVITPSDSTHLQFRMKNYPPTEDISNKRSFRGMIRTPSHNGPQCLETRNRRTPRA